MWWPVDMHHHNWCKTSRQGEQATEIHLFYNWPTMSALDINGRCWPFMAARGMGRMCQVKMVWILLITR